MRRKRMRRERMEEERMEVLACHKYLHDMSDRRSDKRKWGGERVTGQGMCKKCVYKPRYPMILNDSPLY